jgi:hypothetical protein
MKREDVEQALDTAGLERVRSTKKVIEYRSKNSNRVFYFRTEIGLPGYVRVVIHPEETHCELTSIAGVDVNSPKEFQHGSNMSKFPKRKNDGVDEIHYGRALNIGSMVALERFASVFASRKAPAGPGET